MPLTEAATRKVGPLPAWGWGAIAVGGFVAWRMFRPSGNGTTGAGVPSVGAPGDLGSGGGGGGGGSVDTTQLQAAIDTLTTRIGNITIPGTGGGGGSGGVGGGIPTTPTDIANLLTPDAVQQAITAEYAGSGYPIPTIAAGPFPSPDAYKTGYFNTPMELLNIMKQAALKGYGQVQLPDGSYFATNPNTIKMFEENIAGGFTSYGATSPFADPNNPIVGAAPQYTDEIAALRQYIANLEKGGVTPAEATKIATYETRIAEYAARDTQAASGAPPTFSSVPIVAAPSIPAPSTAATPVDYSKAITTVQGYIENLSAVKNPTTAQKQELAMYQARLADYQSR